jgi:hypothetical protein
MADTERFNDSMAAPLQLALDDSTLMTRYFLAIRESLSAGPYETDEGEPLRQYARNVFQAIRADEDFLHTENREAMLGSALLLMCYNTCLDETAVFAGYDDSRLQMSDAV